VPALVTSYLSWVSKTHREIKDVTLFNDATVFV
jgi:hypothetical protein